MCTSMNIKMPFVWTSFAMLSPTTFSLFSIWFMGFVRIRKNPFFHSCEFSRNWFKHFKTQFLDAKIIAIKPKKIYTDGTHHGITKNNWVCSPVGFFGICMNPCESVFSFLCFSRNWNKTFKNTNFGCKSHCYQTKNNINTDDTCHIITQEC